MRHLSFDFWNTLAVPNPAYSVLRNQMLADTFGVTPQEAAEMHGKTKRAIDHRDETPAPWMAPDNDYIELFDGFGRQSTLAHRSWVKSEYSRIFHEEPPLIYDNIRTALLHAHAKGVTLSIGSNTHFIMGIDIAQLLDTLPFSFMVFSDAVGSAKPHGDFYNKIIQGAADLHHNLLPGDIMHVGDNKVCDGGATRYGLGFTYVASPEYTAAAINNLVSTLK